MAAERNWIDADDTTSLDEALRAADEAGMVTVRKGGKAVGLVTSLIAGPAHDSPGHDDPSAGRTPPKPVAESRLDNDPLRRDVATAGRDPLAGVVQEVARTGQPIRLYVDDEPGAVIVPFLPAPPGSPPSGERAGDRAAFLEAIGTWSDVDADSLIHEIYQRRLRGSRDQIDS